MSRQHTTSTTAAKRRWPHVFRLSDLHHPRSANSQKIRHEGHHSPGSRLLHTVDTPTIVGVFAGRTGIGPLRRFSGETIGGASLPAIRPTLEPTCLLEPTASAFWMATVFKHKHTTPSWIQTKAAPKFCYFTQFVDHDQFHHGPHLFDASLVTSKSAEATSKSGRQESMTAYIYIYIYIYIHTFPIAPTH